MLYYKLIDTPKYSKAIMVVVMLFVSLLLGVYCVCVAFRMHFLTSGFRFFAHSWGAA